MVLRIRHQMGWGGRLVLFVHIPLTLAAMALLISWYPTDLEGRACGTSTRIPPQSGCCLPHTHSGYWPATRVDCCLPRHCYLSSCIIHIRNTACTFQPTVASFPGFDT